jgi:N-carbamoylputrescine amidase
MGDDQSADAAGMRQQSDHCSVDPMKDQRQPTSYKVGLVQMAMTPDPDQNLRAAVAKVGEAAAAGAQLVCLPELFRSQYFAQREDAALFDLAEPVPGPSTEALGRAAKQAGVVVIAPLFERRAPGLYHNSAAVIDADGTLVGLYRKMHIPDDPAYYEKFYFTPGDLGFRVFDTRVGRIGTLVCWDQWYPEGARLTALQGAHILLYPAAIGWHPKEKATHGAEQLDAWRTIQRSHAIANGLYVAAVNRVGHERVDPSSDGIEFWGSSFLADPFGTVIAQAPADREAVLIGEVSVARIEEVRRGWPFLRDRRIDAYGGIGERFLDRAPSAISNQPSATSPKR